MFHIYPKLIAKSKIRPNPQCCFVLIPFSQEFGRIYGEIKRTLKRIGFDCRRADDLYDNRPIMTTIVTEILSCHFVIGDLTGRNPNVFYEVGISHALRDLPNVLLISQDLESVPFDLRHLPITIYDGDNLHFLSSELERRILDNKGYFAGKLRIRERFHDAIGGDIYLQEVFDFFDSQPREFRDIVFQLLDREELNSYGQEAISVAVLQLRAELIELARVDRLRLLKNLFLIYVDLLTNYCYTERLSTYIKNVLAEGAFTEFNLPRSEAVGMVIDLALALFAQPRFKRNAMNWLFNYLAKEKVSGVDLNRSKVESFLMRTEDPEVRNNFVLCLSHSQDLLREYAADFVGELQIEEALPTLKVVLKRESNPYIIRSIFTALGKLKSAEAGTVILEWFQENEWMHKEKHLRFLLTHADQALRNLDSQLHTSFEKEFETLILAQGDG